VTGRSPLKDLPKRLAAWGDLGKRVAALEAVLVDSTSAVASFDGRLAAIEDALRRLRHGDEDVDEHSASRCRCRELLSELVPVGQCVAVLTEDDPAVFAPDGQPVTVFPQHSPTDRPDCGFDHSAAAIAQLEVQRVEGTRFLLLPDPARGWLQRYPEFAEHLTNRYDVVADEPGAGLLVDMDTRRRPQQRQRTLVDVLDRLVDGNRYAAILDWTDLDLGSLVAGRSVFTAPAGNDRALPYIERTIDVVVIEDPARLEEGRRVARGAVVVVRSAENGGVLVSGVEEVQSDDVTALDPLLLVAATDPGDPWLTHVEEAVVAQPQVTVVASRDPWRVAATADVNVVLVAERGVLPLPGCIEASSALLASDDRIGGVAAKLLGADGSLEAAGSMVFADGSVENINASCSEMAAPWHEYVRPVCTTTGLLTARPSALRAASIASGSFVAVAAALWRAGYELSYQPDAWAVRALGAANGDRAGGEVASETWAEALPSRPPRPVLLDVRAWRGLLAREEVGSSWR
jgi:hypothetical protein